MTKIKEVITQQKVKNMSMYFNAYTYIAHVLVYAYMCAGVCIYTAMYMNTHRECLT